ncbi:hypothetical protein BJY52DRAFT_1416135 [Lactarius psammicola]|nr:hypothetical protein BJY52DRAFT_1416135 [Lactarius psammicola]
MKRREGKARPPGQPGLAMGLGDRFLPGFHPSSAAALATAVGILWGNSDRRIVSGPFTRLRAAVRGVINAAARALLKNRVTIDKLPEDVLFEIFGAYRQDMELQPDYENVWDSRNGWYKLAHMVREENLALAAIRQRGRVHRISLRRPYTGMAQLLMALGHPFPKLKSLEIRPTCCYGQDLVLPSTFLSDVCDSPRYGTLYRDAYSHYYHLQRALLNLL